MAYNEPKVIAGDMTERETFSCGCPTGISRCSSFCMTYQ